LLLLTYYARSTYSGSRHPRHLRPFPTRRSSDLLATAVKSLRQIKSRDQMRQLFIEIHRVENESDEVYLQALSRLYDQPQPTPQRSEEHTSELQSQSNLVCRLLLEKKNVQSAENT